MPEGTSGPGAEGQPAPLNPQARADVNDALRNAGVAGLDPKAGVNTDVIGKLSIEGLEDDPRIGQIKKELTDGWELLHRSRFDKNGVLRGDFQDYVYGNPADQREGKKPVSLEDRAKRVFEERFPGDAKAYAEKEKTRIYEDPNQDPALKLVEEEILRRTNTDLEVTQAKTKYGEVWAKVLGRFSMSAWNDFTRQYPDKAAAYKDKFQPLQQTFEGQERLRQFREQQAQAEAIGGLAMPLPDESVRSEQPQPFDPSILLSKDSISLDEFFGLDRDQVYGSMHRIAGTANNESMRKKAQHIIDLLYQGKDDFLKNNQGATNINLIKP